MQVLPIHTPVLKEGDDLVSLLVSQCELEDGDIVVVSSKAIATVEGAAIDLSEMEPTKEAIEWSEKCGSSPEFRQAVLDETRRLHGEVLPSCPQAMLTELQPEGLSEGSILAVNAGLDLSNVQEGFAIGWPVDSLKSVQNLYTKIKEISGKECAVIITDSCCRPRRLGVSAMALTVAGMDPLQSEVGKEDLFGHSIRMTHEAHADQLATAANFVMGNSDQAIPAAIIRDHGLELSDWSGWVPGINRNEDLFQGIL